MEKEKLPRPAADDYLRRKELEKKDPDAWVDMMNSFDWSHELIKDGDLVGIRSALGEDLLPPIFENFKLMTNQEVNFGDRVVARHEGKWGVMIANGKGFWRIRPEFDYIGYPNDLTHVLKDGKWGVFDLVNGDYLIKPECEEIPEWNGFMFMNRIGFYKKDGKWGVVTDWGTFTKPIFEEYGGDTDDGQVEVMYQGKWGYINEKNEFTLDEDEAYYYYHLD